MDGCCTLLCSETHTHWSLVTEPAAYTLKDFGWLFSSVRARLTAHSVYQRLPCLASLDRVFQSRVSDRRSQRGAAIGLGTFSILWLAWTLATGILVGSTPPLDPSETSVVLICWLSSLSRLQRVDYGDFPPALKYSLSYFIVRLVCLGGRTSLNRMVSLGVSLVVPSVPWLLPRFALWLAFRRFGCFIKLLWDLAYCWWHWALTLWYGRKRWRCLITPAVIAVRTESRPTLPHRQNVLRM